MHAHSYALAAALLAAPALAQCDFGANTFPFPHQIQAFVADGNLCTWCADVVGDPTKLIGGSARAGRTSMLAVNNPVGIMSVARVPFVAHEGNTDNYFGLTMEGDWLPLTMPGPVDLSVFGQDIMALASGREIAVFHPWARAWTRTSLRNANPTIVPGRSLLVVTDGQDELVGYSFLRDAQAVRYTPPTPRTMLQVTGVGESDTRRNQQAFVVDATTIAVYSGYLASWQILTLPSLVANAQFTYNKNTLYAVDSTLQRVLFYSAVTGTSQTLQVVDSAFITAGSQDFGVLVVDQISNNVYLFRAIDGALLSVPGVARDISFTGHYNNCLIVAAPDAVTGAQLYHGASTSARGSAFQVQPLAVGETVASQGGNDCEFVMATDRSLYGFSAFTNTWSVFPNYQGTFATRFAQDFIGVIETSSHVYVFSPRESRWIERVKGAGAALAVSDQVCMITEGSIKSAYSTNSVGFKTQALAGTLFQQGSGNSYGYAILDNPGTNGSTVYFYQSYGDRWLRKELASRVSDPATVRTLEDSLLIRDGNMIHTFAGFGDITTRWSAPNDNYAWHATRGVDLDLLAAGRPGAAAFVIVGVQRTDLPVLGACGTLQVDPTVYAIAGVGGYDARGLVRFTIPIGPGTPVFTYPVQMVSYGISGLEFGRVLLQTIF